jgi:hypothetical protein
MTFSAVMLEVEQNDLRTHHHLEVHKMFHDVAKAFSEDQVELRQLTQLTLELTTVQQCLSKCANHQCEEAKCLTHKYFKVIPMGHLIEAALRFMCQFQPS